ncbi:sodium:proton antiporter NhaD [Cellvibrio sp. PSBB006]|uniref:sodium:proton antiporter NhaD n=1 Tax=Cellvibrio sp. PSBB006 TaxID=1987723 RepID=UPI000B3B265D|nr:sodium:proton antiporter NhaD [Cellvibrio sp. PSBB006]ARU27137.1 sodium:proton antiporter [Cellvibrio sp. PSBB006]
MPAFLEVVLIGFAILALLGVIFEEVIHINKAKTTLFFGSISWLLMFMFAGSAEQQDVMLGKLDHNLLEIATLWLFLMATMTFVAYLNAKGLIQTLVQRVCPQQMSKRSLMVMVAIFAMILSMICDNVTATLVTLGLVHAFNLDNRTRIKLAVLVVFAVNSGGVALITGDVTTLMIFLAGHVTMLQLFVLIMPAIVGVLALSLMLFPGVTGTVSTDKVQRHFKAMDIAIMVIFFTTIFCTMLFNFFFQIPPVLTFLTGLSVMFLFGHWLRTDKEETRILEYIRQVEYETLLFFLGILLLVGMLKEIGVLDLLTSAYTQFSPTVANYSAGIFSALIDNVPLTAALLKASPSLATSEWLGLTYAVGVGGSLLAIGSAAGIIAMSKVKGLTFGSHIRYFPFLFIAYTLGYWVTITLAKMMF